MKIKSKIKAGPLRACEWVAVKIKTKITAGPTIIIRGRSCA